MDDWDRLRKIGEQAMAHRLSRLTATGQFGKYRLLRRLGEGGMAEVWLAQDEATPVALKILTGLRDSDRQRFQREAELATELNHPRIIKVFESGEIEGYPYIAMEYIPGKPMDSKIADPKEAATLMAEIADAVQCAHDRGVIHRDIKPDNLIRAENGQVYLADFGLARDDQSPQVSTSRSGVILGTPAFMPPELASGHPGDATPQSDIYSLGATLYYLIAGRVPFPGENLYDVLAKVIKAEPEPIEVDRPLGKVLAQAMAKSPSRRYESAREFGEDLRRYIRGESVLARPPLKISKRWVLVALIPIVAGLWYFWDQAQTAGDLRQSLRAAIEARRKGENHALPGLLKVMEEAHRKLPAKAEYECLMGRMHRLMLNDEAALRFQERALESGYAPAQYERDVLLIRLGRLKDKDAAYWNDTVRKNPSSEEAWEGLARIALRNSAWDEAIEWSTKGLSHDAGYIPHLVNRGQAYLDRAAGTIGKGTDASADLAAADSDFSQALRLEPKHVPALIGRAQVRTRRADRSGNILGDLGLAENDCEEAMRLDPKNADAWLWRGIARTNRGTTRARLEQDPTKDYEDAVADISEAIDRRSHHAESWVKRAIARNNISLWRRQFGHNVKAELEAAIGDLAEALRLDPKFAYAFVTRAMVRTQLAGISFNPIPSLDAADQDLAQALQIDPQMADAFLRRGHVHWFRAQRWEQLKKRDEADGEYRAAVKDYEQALTLNGFLVPLVGSRLTEARKKISE